MSWTLLPPFPSPFNNYYATSTSLGSLHFGAQLTNDGRILIALSDGSVNNNNWWSVYSPDEFGRYENGSWSAWQDTGFTQLGGAMILSRDGRIASMGGHPATTGEQRIVVWNPKTSAITSYDGAWPHQGRGTFQPLDDNTWGLMRGLTGTRILSDSTFLTVDTWYGESLSGSESPAALMPDGRVISLPTGDSGPRFPPYSASELRPAYSASLVAEGSYAGNGSVFNRTGITASTNASTSWMYSASGPSYAGVSTVDHEVCGQVYMPKVGKIVTIGGELGEVFQYDPVNAPSVVEVKHVAPHAYSPPGAPLTLDSRHAGQTAQDIINSGTVYLTGSLSSQWIGASKRVYIPLPNGKWCMLVGTAGTIPTAPATVTVGATYTISGLKTSSDIEYNGLGDLTTVIPTGAFISSVLTKDYVLEGGLCILPSGNLFYVAGTTYPSAGTSNVFSRVMTWNGIDNPTPVETPGLVTCTDGSTRNFSFVISNGAGTSPYFVLLPTGQVLVVSNRGMWLWDDTSPADQSAKPVLDYFPSKVTQGSYYQLSGRQLHGIHVGAQYGDEMPLVCNHPIAMLKNKIDGKVYFCPTTNYSYRGIKPMRSSTCTVEVPSTVPVGLYSLTVASAGNVSDVRDVTVMSKLPTQTVSYDHYNNR